MCISKLTEMYINFYEYLKALEMHHCIFGETLSRLNPTPYTMKCYQNFLTQVQVLYYLAGFFVKGMLIETQWRFTVNFKNMLTPPNLMERTYFIVIMNFLHYYAIIEWKTLCCYLGTLLGLSTCDITEE